MTIAREPVNLLFICTANQCRSPMAAAIARYELTLRAVPGLVSSAGFLDGGSPAAKAAERACAERGLDLSRHISQHVDEDMLGRADVVLTMEGGHVLDIAAIDPELARRAVPLGAAVAASEAAAAPQSVPLGPDELRAWATASNRDLAVVLDPRHDVADPMGASLRRHRQTRDQLVESISRLFDAWFGGPAR